MKKRFFLMMSLICMLLATATVSAATNDDTDASYTITLSDDKTELTISGKGDLTTFNSKKYYFVNTLPGALYAGDNRSNVSGGAAYDASTTYATRTRTNVYKEIENFADTHTTVKTHYYFSETGAKKYYVEVSDWTTGSEVKTKVLVTEGTEVSTKTVSVVDPDNTSRWTDMSIYFTKSGDEYTRVKSYTDITSVAENVTSKELKHLSNCNDVYVQNGTGYTAVYNDALYDEAKTYYQLSYDDKYTALTLDELNDGGYLRYEGGIVDEIWKNISANNIATVKFVNVGTDPLVIDNSIASALLYYKKENYGTTYFEPNTSLTTLDMGAATCKGFSQATFGNTVGANGTLHIATLTLPLAEDKTVPSMVVESIREGNGSAIVKDITVPDGYTAIGDEAFINVNKVNSFTLPNSIETIGKKAFYGTNITTWVLPTSLTTIGDDAFGSSSVTDVTFPESLRTIGKGAFAICNSLDNINLNKGLEIIGNSAFYLASKNDKSKVLEIPASVKYIGPGAFNFRWYSDVYYYGEKAPISPYGKAYSSQDVVEATYGSQLLFGNNGFTPAAYEGSTAGDIQKGYANRENYLNGGTYIAVLHFRSDIGDTNAETFTDITRKYEIYYNDNGTWNANIQKKVGEETSSLNFGGYYTINDGMVNTGYEDTDLGKQRIWPSQAQFNRSYVVNSCGYKWNGVDKYLPNLTEDEINLIKTQEEGISGSTLSTASDEELKKIAYLGTRQFVLVSRDVKGNPGEVDPGITDGGRWWTLCVPCDVRKSEVDRVFGKDSYLCLFSKVERESTKGGAANVIHLYFQNDTYQRQYTRQNDGTWKVDGAYTDDDPVVLYAHTPYMIYPKNRKDDGHDFILRNYEIKSGDVLRSKVVATDNTEYVYTSTYLDKTAEGSGVTIPQYSYAFGTTKTNKTPQFWFYTGTNGAWKSYKCLVQRYDENGSEDFASFFKGNVNNARQFSTFGQDSEVTGVDKVIIHIGEGENEAIYSIDGTLVSKSGDISSLTKGVYIQNGKKFLVK